ncbi:MAG: response regulator [Actinomycetota bacterium]|nr:response regulator [Actinomycetota bacterium]
MEEKKINILVVEDSETQNVWLRQILEKNGYQVSATYNGKEALAVIAENEPALIISDILMPVMDGYEFCKIVKMDRNLKDIPVILLTLLDNPKDIIKGLECGADYFMTKPCDEKNLLARVQHILKSFRDREPEESLAAVEVFHGGQKYNISLGSQQIIDNLLFAYEIAIQRNRDLRKAQEDLRAFTEHLEEKVKEEMAAFVAESTERKRVDEELQFNLEKLQRTFQETVHALASASEKRDPHTAGHQQRVAELACGIAKNMGLHADQIEGIRVAGLLHDIGKVSIPAEILNRPGTLADIEFSIIKNHPQHGFDILKTIEFPWPIAQIVIQHHERLDGSGYPLGLLGDRILLDARIVAVADVVDAMISHRPYRPACDLDVVLAELNDNRGVLYDLEVVDACLKLFENKNSRCA